MPVSFNGHWFERALGTSKIARSILSPSRQATPDLPKRSFPVGRAFVSRAARCWTFFSEALGMDIFWRRHACDWRATQLLQ